MNKKLPINDCAWVRISDASLFCFRQFFVVQSMYQYKHYLKVIIDNIFKFSFSQKQNPVKSISKKVYCSVYTKKDEMHQFQQDSHFSDYQPEIFQR